MAMVRTPARRGVRTRPAGALAMALIALVGVVAGSLAGCSSGSDGGAPATTRSTTTTTLRPGPPIAPSKVDPCRVLGAIDLQRFGAVGRIVRGTSGTARMCTRSVRIPDRTPVRHVKVQVFVNGSVSVREFRRRVARNFRGSTCTVRPVPAGEAAYVETCHGQGTGLDLSIRKVHVGILLTGPVKDPTRVIVVLAQAAARRIDARDRPAG